MNKKLRDELDLRRRRVLDALDDLMEDRLGRRVAEWRREKLVSDIERLLEQSDTELLRMEQLR